MKAKVKVWDSGSRGRAVAGMAIAIAIRFTIAVILLAGSIGWSYSGAGEGDGSTWSWPLTASNSWIEDIPTLHDFIPLGVVHLETPDHILQNLPDPRWGLQCFILVADGESPDGQHKIIVQARLPIEGSMRHRIYLDGEWFLLPATRAPMYLDDEGREFPYPTVYTLGETSTSLSYDEQGRRWLLRIEDPARGLLLEVEGRARGIPFWMGKAEGPYIIHGVATGKPDIDIWGGFWDVGTCEIRLSMPDYEGRFYGHFLFDRAYHRAYFTETASGRGGLADFTCMHIHSEDFDLMLSRSLNPSPLKTPVPLQHQARLNFPDRGESFRFDGFRYWDDGGLQPKEFHITGEYEAGEVNLTGVAYEYWPERWGIARGSWWEPNGRHTWGRAFIRWTGTITLHDETIKVVGALGVGEFTRFAGGGG